MNSNGETPLVDEAGNTKANPVYVRWVNNKDGSKIGVPEDWLSGPVGRIFVDSKKPTGNGKLVEVVQE